MTNTKTKTNLSSILGVTVAWYDFLIFNIATALIFPKLFFPDMGPMLPILAFAVGFLFRPLGSMIFGHIGDRLGRKFSMILTLLVTGISTVTIGLLPTYQEIGVLATVLLVLARLAQTAAIGGEYGAVSTLLTEHNSDSKRQSLITSFTTVGFSLAAVLASTAFYLATNLGQEDFQNWTWRLPFLFSGILLILGVYMRHSVSETTEFSQAQARQALSPHPVRTLFRDHWRLLSIGALAVAVAPSWTYAIMVFGSGYVVQANLMPRSEITEIQMWVWMLIAAVQLIFAWLADKIDRYRIVWFCLLSSLVLAYPVFYFLQQGMMLAAMLSLLLVMAPALAVSPILFCKLFPVQIRQSGSGITYNLALVVSGLLSVLSQHILITTNNIMHVGTVFLIFTVISMLALYRLQKHDHQRSCRAV